MHRKGDIIQRSCQRIEGSKSHTDATVIATVIAWVKAGSRHCGTGTRVLKRVVIQARIEKCVARLKQGLKAAYRLNVKNLNVPYARQLEYLQLSGGETYTCPGEGAESTVSGPGWTTHPKAAVVVAQGFGFHSQYLILKSRGCDHEYPVFVLRTSDHQQRLLKQRDLHEHGHG
jgi:hypothetical protein